MLCGEMTVLALSGRPTVFKFAMGGFLAQKFMRRPKPRLLQMCFYVFVVLSFVSNSLSDLPSLFFHSVSPFALRPITITAAVDGLLKM